MASLRFSRDRRGYEHFYLVESLSPRRGKARERILFWFRTPPNVKVGREPFADHVRRALEAQNPGISFDWDRLLATPIPPPAAGVERWREKRRAMRAPRLAAEAEAAAELEEAAMPSGIEIVQSLPDTEPEPSEPSPPEVAAGPPSQGSPPTPGRRRNRRRGGRRHRPASTGITPSPGPQDGAVEAGPGSSGNEGNEEDDQSQGD